MQRLRDIKNVLNWQCLVMLPAILGAIATDGTAKVEGDYSFPLHWICIMVLIIDAFVPWFVRMSLEKFEEEMKVKAEVKDEDGFAFLTLSDRDE